MRKLLVVLLLAAGCGGPADPTPLRAADLEAGVRALDRALGISTGFVDSGVVNTAAPPDVIASSIYQRTQTQSGGCIKGTRTGAEVDLDFGTGCTVATAGLVYSGPLKAVVSMDSIKGIDITLTLSGTVDGQALGGTFLIITPDGNTFSYEADLTFGAVHVKAPNLMGGVAAQGGTLDGTGTLEGPSSTGIAGGWQLTLTGVHQGFTACYPDDGTAALASPSEMLLYSFSSQTPQNGQASLSASGAMSTVTLPARMGCPPGR